MTSVIIRFFAKHSPSPSPLHSGARISDKSAEASQSNHNPTFPGTEERLEDLEIGVLFNGSYEIRRVVITNDYLIFAEPQQENIVDFIPFADVFSVDDLDGVTADSEPSESQSLAHIASLETVASTLSAFQIRTFRGGYNCGRKYCLQAASDHQCDHLIETLTKLARAARRKLDTRTSLQRARDYARSLYDSTPFQLLSAALITTTLIMSGFEAQVPDQLVNSDGSLTDLGHSIDVGNTAITILFAAELCFNLFSHPAREFFGSLLNVWDVCVVLLSLASLGPLDTQMPITILRFFRVVRTLRVLKIFARLPELRRIFSALSYSIVPMLNAFVIVLVMMLMYSIVGVTYFRDDAPDDFGRLDLAFVAMFRITAGPAFSPAFLSLSLSLSLSLTLSLSLSLSLLALSLSSSLALSLSPRSLSLSLSSL